MSEKKPTWHEWHEVCRQNARLERENERLKDVLRTISRLLMPTETSSSRTETRDENRKEQ